MDAYIRTKKLDIITNTQCDLVIEYNGIPLCISAIGTQTNIKTFCKNITTNDSSVTAELRDRSNIDFIIPLRLLNNSFKFKKFKMDNGMVHVMVINDAHMNFVIDWDNIGKTKLISAYLRNSEYLPVNDEIVEKMIELQESGEIDNKKWFVKLNVFYNNPIFDNLSGYGINVKSFLYHLKKVTVSDFYSDFDWDKIEDIMDYTFAFLDGIRDRLKNNVRTLYDPNKISPHLTTGFKLYDGQIPTSQASLEVLKHNKCVYINAEPGFGKTLVSLKVLYAYMQEKNQDRYNCLLVVPTITARQWESEISKVFQDTQDFRVIIVSSGAEFIRHYEKKPTMPTFYIVGKEAFKLDSPKKPAVLYRKDPYTKTMYAICPSCGEMIPNKNKKIHRAFLSQDDFVSRTIFNGKCDKCEAKLWQASYAKTAKTSIINYIKTKKLIFDVVICDEIHESNNHNSLIGTATRTLIKNHAKKTILLSGTSNDGYASSLHNILMAISPRKLIEDNCLSVNNFVNRYGTLQATLKSPGPVNISEVPSTEFVEIPGINPICFIRYLSSQFVFARLNDLSKDLPSFKEIFVPIIADHALQKASAILASTIKTISPHNYKRYEDSIVKHFINNPYQWSEIPIPTKQGLEYVHPENLNEYTSNKEKKLVEICLQEKYENRKVWVFTDFSGTGGKYMSGVTISDRLKKLLETNGFKVFVLKASVRTIDRKEILEKNMSEYDIFISNPMLINVGINLQAVPTYIFYMPSYRVNVVEQAKRRGMRANSTLDNRVFHLYYSNTVEKNISEYYQKKNLEAKAIEGKFDVATENDNLRTASAFGKKINDIKQ